jgi:four helix bundle protein
MFEHERLDVYQYARELNREICRLSKIARKGNYDHIDQVIRCGSSITRNLAEGCGDWQPKEKAKFYRYAKRSAGECAAGLDVLVDYDMLRDEDVPRQGIVVSDHPHAHKAYPDLRRWNPPARCSGRRRTQPDPQDEDEPKPELPGPGSRPVTDPDRSPTGDR